VSAGQQNSARSAKVAAIREHAAQERQLLDGLPPEARQVLTLQLKPRWTRTDRARIAGLTRAWTPVHKQVFADRFSIGRPMRWS
jgi:hypothetical protein